MVMIKQIFIKMLPGSLKDTILHVKLFFQLIAIYFEDAKDYRKHSATFSFSIQKCGLEILDGRIIAHYHVIEKGLSLEEPRPGFGQKVIKDLLELLAIYIKKSENEIGFAFENAIHTLKKYIEFNEKHGFEVLELKKSIENLYKTKATGGNILTTKNQFLKNIKSNFYEFSFGRHSLRNFIDRDVSDQLISDIVFLANNYPSSCNRQPVRCYIIKNKKVISEILDLQGGSRGFGNKFNILFLVTSNLNIYHGIQERNQAYVDGGIYIMNLLYSIHFFGLGSCPLAWYVSPKKSKKIKDLIKVPENNKIIALIGAGHLPENFSYAESKRFPHNNLTKIIY